MKQRKAAVFVDQPVFMAAVGGSHNKVTSSWQSLRPDIIPKSKVQNSLWKVEVLQLSQMYFTFSEKYIKKKKKKALRTD